MQFLDSINLGWGPRSCNSNKLPGDGSTGGRSVAHILRSKYLEEREVPSLFPSLLAFALYERTCSLDWSDSRKLIGSCLTRAGLGTSMQLAVLLLVAGIGTLS